LDKKPEKRALGRGLSALMSDINLSTGDGDFGSGTRGTGGFNVSVHSIRPNPDQPRRSFDPSSLSELAESIRSKGIIQPLVVRAVTGDTPYEIVAGERRWRAAQMAQLHEVPVVVREFTDIEAVEIAIIENIQRTDLNAMEEAAAFRQLMDKFGHTQEKLAEALSKSRSHIANTLRLLSLPDDVQALVVGGKLSAGHARALIGADDPVALALKVVGLGLSVRKTEELARKVAIKRPDSGSGKRRGDKDADTRALEEDLSANLRMSVRIDHDTNGEGGNISIKYNSLDQLDGLCQVLSLLRRDL
jgi:ParB family chromosome partitioning protein